MSWWGAMKIEQGEEQVVVDWLTRHQRGLRMKDGMSRTFLENELAGMRMSRSAPPQNEVVDLVDMLAADSTKKLSAYLRVRRSRARLGRRQVELSAEAFQVLSDIAYRHGVGMSEAVLMLANVARNCDNIIGTGI